MEELYYSKNFIMKWIWHLLDFLIKHKKLPNILDLKLNMIKVIIHKFINVHRNYF